MALLLPLAAVAALLFTIGASAGPVSTASGFEGDDANLVANSVVDWNSFKTTTWTGTSPYRQATKVASGWTFTGIEDDQAANGDTAFAGGTKQDDNCATPTSGKAPNKDDLKRIYIASKTIGTGASAKTYLALAWARIPQNTTSASAHAAFEFNQSSTGCGGGSKLVQRSTAHGGDMLIVYDFEGGSSAPVLKLLRWQSTGTCEASGKPAATNGPCWVFSISLTAQGYAEAKVNTEDATDEVAPNGNDTLHSQEFGEAVIDLTSAGVFPAEPTDCLSFGRVFGVSRSSGNSAQAQMKDLVGPADINIGNCASVVIRKVTSPAGDTATSFTYSTNVQTLPGPSSVANFLLKDGGIKTIADVKPASSRTVTESDPGTAYALTAIDCDVAGHPSTATSISRDTGTRSVSFSIAAGQVLDCTFTNTKQKVESSINTAPWIYPNDKATVAAATGQTDIAGSVTFKLYAAGGGNTAAANCAANDATGLVYSETVALDVATGTSKEVTTHNPGTVGSPNSYKVESSATVYWRVSYGGDTNHLGRLSDCVENINATLTVDTGGTNVP